MPNTYNQILTRGTKANLPTTPIVDGKIRLTTDTEQLFVDFGVTRLEITDIVRGKTEDQIRSTENPLDKVYLSSDTHLLLYYDTTNSTWINLSASISPSSTTPAAVAITGSVGTSTLYARGDHVHPIAVASGDASGQVKIAGQNVAVTGLGSLAYESVVTSTMIDSTNDTFDMDFGELTDNN